MHTFSLVDGFIVGGKQRFENFTKKSKNTINKIKPFSVNKK